MATCCGRRRRGRFCSTCGRELVNDPIGAALLGHAAKVIRTHELQVQGHQRRLKSCDEHGHDREPVEKQLEAARRHVTRWQTFHKWITDKLEGGK